MQLAFSFAARESAAWVVVVAKTASAIVSTIVERVSMFIDLVFGFGFLFRQRSMGAVAETHPAHSGKHSPWGDTHP